MRHLFLLSVLVFLCAAETSVVQISAAESAPRPFVSGFERFAVHEEIDDELAGGLLISELSCAACHATSNPLWSPKGGPRLDAVGSRLQHDFLTRYLNDPAATKPGTTMPNVLSALDATQRPAAIDALVAYLGSLKQTFPEIKGTGANPVPYRFWEHGDAENGRRLYHRIGCVACHEPDADYETAEVKASPLDAMLEQLDPEELEDLGLSGAARRVASVPHGDVASKYTPLSLTHFLLDPEKVRPSGRMPNLKLLVVEAADIAAYLLSDSSSDSSSEAIAAAPRESDVTSTRIDEGRKLFVSLGCANCHRAGDIKPSLAARPLAALASSAGQGCLAAEDPQTPRFGIDELQTHAITSALSAAGNGASTSDAVSLQAHFLQMNCYGCHQRDELGGVGRYRKNYFETVGHVDLGDEGRLPPPLSNVGRKLNGTWLTKVLQGSNADLRPHMQIRMPKFPGGVAKSMVPLLTKVDGASSKLTDRSADQVFGETKGKELIEAGRQLMDAGCVQCHQFDGDSLPGIVGIDLNQVSQRLQPQWFHDFLLNPGSLKKQTRMPTFFPDGVSSNPAILDGDAERQIAAIWAYLANVPKHGLPEKIREARAQDYELVPVERPVVLRTFMQQAGQHAIAVGFPEGLHYAFDAEKVRLAVAWRGRFLDAQGTWFIRSAPPADPLGDALVTMPEGPLFANLKDLKLPWPDFDESASAVRFDGYRLDSQGVPVMLYRWNGIGIEDRIVAEGPRQLKRTVRMTRDAESQSMDTLWLRANTGKTLTKTEDGGFVNDQAVTVLVSETLRDGTRLRSWKEHQEYLVPVAASTQELELWYRW
ncbi:Cytochrome c [Rosistilla carotiformis]|uniref:Cytochrome c n=1 Tax=Rosistilla carotiformis TaxID=2528017 RepID=A0A518JZS0_9BACT|nr:cytochrome c [Rosistilla carotiformis]QDV71047.1 Cytochrome c [Rosistilla carotiformis]